MTNKESFINLQKYIKEAKEFGPDTGFIGLITLTKSDLEENREVSNDEAL